MPLIRKIITLKTAKAVILPKSWLDFFERKYGCEIHEVAVEINGELRIKPIIPEGRG